MPPTELKTVPIHPAQNEFLNFSNFQVKTTYLGTIYLVPPVLGSKLQGTSCGSEVPSSLPVLVIQPEFNQRLRK